MKKLTQGNQFICPKWYSSRILASTVRIFPFSKQPALDLVQFSCMIDLSSASAHKAIKNFLSLGKNCLLMGNCTGFPLLLLPFTTHLPKKSYVCKYPCVHFPVHLFLQPLKIRLLFLHALKLISQLETLCSIIITIDLSGPISFSLESDTTEWLHFHFSLSCIGEGNGNPLQCSCLENPRDGGAWWVAVYGSHRVGHDWSDAAAAAEFLKVLFELPFLETFN